MHDKVSRTLILDSLSQPEWSSIQEVKPVLIDLWRSTQVNGRHEVVTILIDRVNIKEVIAAALNADQIVIPFFSKRCLNTALAIRKYIHPQARLFIYLYGMATVACWPLFESGLSQVLRSDDIFIASCQGDLKLMNLNFHNATTVHIPFTISRETESDFRILPAASSNPIPLVYVGRISEQKNIHTLISSLKVIKALNTHFQFDLTLYGAEDNYGSPNMGLKSSGYLNSLMDLTKRLNIESSVHFKGHLERKVLFDAISCRKHIFVSASLHSDENFGLSAFKALCQGHSAVLSRWGGHIDFGTHFRDRLNLVPVYESLIGPYIKPSILAEAIVYNAKYFYQKEHSTHLPKSYSFLNIVEKMKSLVFSKPKERHSLIPTSNALEIEKRRRGQRLFESYADPLAQPYFTGYGMMKTCPIENKIPKLVPWATEHDNWIKIQDPHRGPFLLKKDGTLAKKLGQYGFTI